MEKKECASPQQLDGISNIRSRNVRNAGQSDLTEKEGGEDRRIRKGKKEEEEEIRARVAQEKSRGVQHCPSL